MRLISFLFLPQTEGGGIMWRAAVDRSNRNEYEIQNQSYPLAQGYSRPWCKSGACRHMFLNAVLLLTHLCRFIYGATFLWPDIESERLQFALFKQI